MYTMKILEREPALSHFLSAHLPPQWGRALSSAPAGRADLVVVSPDLIQVPSAPTACRALLAPGSLAHLAGELSADLGGELRPDPPGHPHLLQPGAGYPLPGSAAGTGHPVRGLPGTPGMAPAPAKSSLSPLPSGLRGPSAAAWGSRRRRSGWAGDRGRLFPHKKKDIRLDVFFCKKIGEPRMDSPWSE